MELICVLSMLGICTVQDVRKKQISIWIAVAFAVGGIALYIWKNPFTLQELSGGMALGGILLVLAFLTRESIGMGDGLLLVVTGLYLGFWENLWLILGALGLASLASLVLVVVHKKGRTYEMPFVPFMLISYVVMVAAQCIEVYF